MRQYSNMADGWLWMSEATSFKKETPANKPQGFLNRAEWHPIGFKSHTKKTTNWTFCYVVIENLLSRFWAAGQHLIVSVPGHYLTCRLVEAAFHCCTHVWECLCERDGDRVCVCFAHESARCPLTDSPCSASKDGSKPSCQTWSKFVLDNSLKPANLGSYKPTTERKLL